MISTVYAGFNSRFGVFWSSNTQKVQLLWFCVVRAFFKHRFVYEIMSVDVETNN